jgi:hypothetical protein
MKKENIHLEIICGTGSTTCTKEIVFNKNKDFFTILDEDVPEEMLCYYKDFMKPFDKAGLPNRIDQLRSLHNDLNIGAIVEKTRRAATTGKILSKQVKEYKKFRLKTIRIIPDSHLELYVGELKSITREQNKKIVILDDTSNFGEALKLTVLDLIENYEISPDKIEVLPLCVNENLYLDSEDGKPYIKNGRFYANSVYSVKLYSNNVITPVSDNRAFIECFSCALSEAIRVANGINTASHPTFLTNYDEKIVDAVRADKNWRVFDNERREKASSFAKILTNEDEAHTGFFVMVRMSFPSDKRSIAISSVVILPAAESTEINALYERMCGFPPAEEINPQNAVRIRVHQIQNFIARVAINAILNELLGRLKYEYLVELYDLKCSSIFGDTLFKEKVKDAINLCNFERVRTLANDLCGNVDLTSLSETKSIAESIGEFLTKPERHNSVNSQVKYIVWQYWFVYLREKISENVSVRTFDKLPFELLRQVFIATMRVCSDDDIVLKSAKFIDFVFEAVKLGDENMLINTLDVIKMESSCENIAVFITYPAFRRGEEVHHALFSEFRKTPPRFYNLARDIHSLLRENSDFGSDDKHEIFKKIAVLIARDEEIQKGGKVLYDNALETIKMLVNSDLLNHDNTEFYFADDDGYLESDYYSFCYELSVQKSKVLQ